MPTKRPDNAPYEGLSYKLTAFLSLNVQFICSLLEISCM